MPWLYAMAVYLGTPATKRDRHPSMESNRKHDRRCRRVQCKADRPVDAAKPKRRHLEPSFTCRLPTHLDVRVALNEMGELIAVPVVHLTRRIVGGWAAALRS